MLNLASFWKPEACGQTVLPDMSILKGQKLVENAKIQKFNCDILSNIQTRWKSHLVYKTVMKSIKVEHYLFSKTWPQTVSMSDTSQ